MSRSYLGLGLLLPALLVGCTRKDPQPAAESTTRADADVREPAPRGSASAAAETSDAAAPRPIVGGLAGMLLDATRAQTLSATQLTTLDEVARSLLTERRGMREAEDALRADVLATVRGLPDAGAAQARFAAVTEAARARAEDEARALVRIHRALDPAQRKAVAADVRAKVTTRRENAKAFEKKPGAPAAPDPRLKARAARLERELSLDDAQKKTLEGLVTGSPGSPPAEAHFTRQLTLLAAFEANDFDDAKAIEASAPTKLRAPTLVEDAKFYLGLAAVLRPPQREKLAGIMQVGDRKRLRIESGHQHREGEHGPGLGMPRPAPPGDHDDGD